MKRNRKHLLALFMAVCFLCVQAAAPRAAASSLESPNEQAREMESINKQGRETESINEQGRETESINEQGRDSVRNETISVAVDPSRIIWQADQPSLWNLTVQNRINTAIDNQLRIGKAVFAVQGGISTRNENITVVNGNVIENAGFAVQDGEVGEYGFDRISYMNDTKENVGKIISPILLYSENTYPANQTIAGITQSVISLSLKENTAVVPMTVDNFWIADRRPSTEKERGNQPEIVLGKNRGQSLSVNGKEVTGDTSDLGRAKALIAKAQASVEEAAGILAELKEEENKKALQQIIDQAKGFISTAQSASDDDLLAYVEETGYEKLNDLAGNPSVIAYALLTKEQGEIDADTLGRALGINTDELTTFAARSGFNVPGLIAFFTEKRLTLQDFKEMLQLIQSSGYTLDDFIQAGVLDNEGVAGLVVRLEDSDEGIQAVFTAPSGTTYQFCGAVVLNNGKQIQLGDPCNKQDTSQKFGEVKMDTQGPTCFFSTVYNEKLGLFPGEMLMNRYMVIQDEKEKPVLCWFDENGAMNPLGLLDDLDPDGSIRKLFEEAKLEKGLPRELDLKTFPDGYQYIAHQFVYKVQRASTCVRKGIKLITCEKCDLQMARDLPLTAHTLTAHAKVEATCTEAGTEAYWSCSVCKKLFAAGTEIQAPVVIAAKGHTLTTHAKVDATCTEPGTEAYWSCDVCNKLFSDEKAETEIEAPVVIAAKGHTLTTHAKVDATCTEAGTEAYWSCDVCNKRFSDEKAETEIEAPVVIEAGHTEVTDAAKAATCTETGLTEGKHCSVCNEVLVAQEIISAKGHTLTTHAKVDATCTEAGTEAYWSCDVCNKLFSDEKAETEIKAPVVIEAKGHTLEKIDAVEPTTEKAGNSAYWKCTVCGKYFSDANGETEITENSWIIRLPVTIETDNLTIEAQSGMTVGELISLYVSDWNLQYNGKSIGTNAVIQKSDVDVSLDSMSGSIPAEAFQVTVKFEPEQTDIYESATETFSVTITQAMSIGS